MHSNVGYVDIALGAFVAGCTLIKQLQSSSAGQGKKFCDNIESDSLANCSVGLAHDAIQKLRVSLPAAACNRFVSHTVSSVLSA